VNCPDMACGLYHLSTGFGFGEVSDGEAAVSKVKVSLPTFSVIWIEEEITSQFWAKVELDAEQIIRSCGPEGT
jgi:hypothetical protein